METLEGQVCPRPGPGQVLVRVAAAGLNPLDLRTRSGDLRWIHGRRFPQITGNDLAGTIEACGADCGAWRPGDRVFALADAYRRASPWGFAKGGTHAEYCLTRADTLAPAPPGIPSWRLAALPMVTLSALQGLRAAGARRGQSLLVIGAGGGLGMAAVQWGLRCGLALGAVCRSPARPILSAWGVERFFEQAGWTPAEAGDWDLVFDASGRHGFAACRGLLGRRGVFVANRPSLGGLAANALRGVVGRRGPSQVLNWVHPRGSDLALIGAALAEGELQPLPVQTYPLDRAAEAHRRLDAGGVLGKLVIQVDASGW